MSTQNNQVTDSENYCEHCNRTFARASTALKHMCEHKRRWLDRDKASNRIAFQGWAQFYAHTTTSKKTKEYKDFIKSNYYTAFVKWGNYCVGINAVNPSRYLDWLLKNNIRVDTWSQDSHYNKYLSEYLRYEDPLDALRRTVEWSMDFADDQGIRSQDVFRFGNTNRIIQAICNGKVSPWVLYLSKSGHEFLNQLLPEQVTFMNDYIDPTQWNIIMRRYPERVSEVTEILKQAGW